MKKVERSFQTTVRLPYQDAIAFALRVHDFHIEQSIRDPNNKVFHESQARRMKTWIEHMKEFIVRNESSREREA